MENRFRIGQIVQGVYSDILDERKTKLCPMNDVYSRTTETCT